MGTRKGSGMHASVVRFQLPPDQLENATAGIKENSARLPNTPGFQHAYWIYDRDQTMMTAVVLFDTADHAAAAWEEASPRVTENIKAVGATPDARMGEVVHQV
jgi:hypothetical protein